MMYAASEKLAIIRLVEESELSVRRTLREIKVCRSIYVPSWHNQAGNWSAWREACMTLIGQIRVVGVTQRLTAVFDA